jgi:hypothetical protein
MILLVLKATLVLWMFFIVTTKAIDDANKLSDLTVFRKVFVVAFVIFDVLYDLTFGKILFWELTDSRVKFYRGKGKITLTARLKSILLSGEYKETEWRYILALFMCKYMVSPWDFNHCGMGYGKK